MSHAGALLTGALSAFILAVALTYGDTPLLFLAYMTGIPLFIAGLGAGALASLLATSAGSASLYFAGPSNICVLYIFLCGIPAILLTTIALRYRMGNDGKAYWYPTGCFVALLPVYVAIIFAVLASLAASHEHGLLGLSQESFQAIKNEIEQSARIAEAQIDPQIIKSGIEKIAYFAPALFGSTWITIMLLSMLVAQRILRARNWNLRDSFELRELRLPAWLVYLMVGLALMATLTSDPYRYYAHNLAILFGLPFLLAGLAVVHALVSPLKGKTLILVAFYVVLTFIAWLGLLVMLFGIVDHWMDFRRRWGVRAVTR